jgi:hypothetical protein
MGLSMEDVRTSIANANAVGPLGTFDGDKRAVTIGINNQLRTASEYDPLVVKTVDGTVIRLSTVASIRPVSTNALRYNTDRGVWHEYSQPFDAALLKAGENEMTLTVPAGDLTSGVCYDYLRLELNEK